MTYEPKVGDKVLISGVVKAVERVDFGVAVPVRCTAQVKLSNGCLISMSAGEFELETHAPASGVDPETERLARLMCVKSYGEGYADCIVNKFQMPVIGPGGHRFILPAPDQQMPLWHTFIEAAEAVIEDKETQP